jgi:multiple sugar transport system permease protein
VSDLQKQTMTVVMSILGFAMVLPFLWMLSASFKSSMNIFKYPIEWIPKNPRLENYTTVWLNKTYPFYLFFFNSLKVALLSIAGLIFISSTAAYAFAKIDFKGKNLIFMIYLATMMIPAQATLVPRFALFRNLGIYDTHWALIFPASFNIVGIFMLRQFFISIPKELSESAKIDGAGYIRIWWQIILPLAKPALLSLVILGFVWSWNDYTNALIFITTKEKYTIPVGLQAFMEDDMTQYNLIMTGATCAILPIILLFLFSQKYFIKGIATSGIKG